MRCLLVPAILAVMACATSARADDDKPAIAPLPSDVGELIARPHTIAELEMGIIALPTAPIGNGQRGLATPLGLKGDATLLTGIHLLYRGGREWAIGAGVLLGPSPTNDDQYGGLGALRRTHSRSYMFIGTEGRDVPLHLKWIEGWVGLSAGGIIIADRFVTKSGEDVAAILGTKQVTIGTEGFSLGVQAGADWLFTERWVVGFALRANRWLLPQSPQCTPIGDCATLTGTVESFEMGLRIGYRIPL